MINKKKVAVIGGGPSGIAATRRLLEGGLQVTLFEEASELGGMWTRGAYEGLVTNTPLKLTTFPGFPLVPSERLSVSTYASCAQMGSYMHSVAEYLDIFGRCEVLLCHRVVSLEYRDSRWLVNGTRWFDAVAVCTGHHWFPKMPPFLRGVSGVTHSRDYVNPGAFRDRRVLVFGMGVSGAEIGVQLLAAGVHVAFSSHRHGAPSRTLIDADIGDAAILPEIVAVSCLSGGALEVEFAGVKGRRCFDAIICCTGYTMHAPFLDPSVWQQIHRTRPGEHLRLWKRCVLPDKSLAMLGWVTTHASLHPVADVQARLFAAVLRGEVAPVGVEEEIDAWVDSRRNIRYRFSNVDYWTYIRDLERMLKSDPTLPVDSDLWNRTLYRNFHAAQVGVACLQFPSEFGFPEINRERIAGYIRTVVHQDPSVRFVVLPEAALSGYMGADLECAWGHQFHPRHVAECVPGPSTIFFSELASELGVFLVVTLIEKALCPATSADEAFLPPLEGDLRFYNTAVLICDKGRIVSRYRKYNHWARGDGAWMTAGTQCAVYRSPYGLVGLAICFDVHIMFERYAKEHPDLWLLLYPIAWVDNEIHSWFNRDLGELFVRPNGSYYVAGANWATAETTSAWRGYGSSSVYSPDGALLARAAEDGLGFSYCVARIPVDAASRHPAAAAPLRAPSLASSGDSASLDAKFPLSVAGVTVALEQLSSGPGGRMPVWQCGVELARLMESQCCCGERSVFGSRVLELGSGTGLAGLALAMLGARVTLSDTRALLPLLRRNAAAFSCWGNCRVAELDWSALPDDTELPAVDLVVGADLVYDVRITRMLLRAVSALVQCTLSQTHRLEFVFALQMHLAAAMQVFFRGIAALGGTVQVLLRRDPVSVYSVVFRSRAASMIQRAKLARLTEEMARLKREMWRDLDQGAAVAVHTSFPREPVSQEVQRKSETHRGDFFSQAEVLEPHLKQRFNLH